LREEPEKQPRDQGKNIGRTIDRLRRPRGRRRLSPSRLVFWLAAGLALAAVVLLVHYALQASSLRRQLEELRQIALPATPPESLTDLENAAAGDDADERAGDTLAAGPSGLSTAPPPAPPTRDFGALRGRNADIAAWLRYPGIRDIDLPVVQRDNAFYMTHDYLGRENVSGSVFADQRNSFSPRDGNIVLYGHNMKNGTMFGKLYRLSENGLLGEEPFFTLETPESSELYVPYAIALVDDATDHPRYFPIATLNYRSDAELLTYAGRLRSFSDLQFPVAVESRDRLLTLVTCHGESDSERLVVALRALRPGEDAEALREAMRRAF